MANPALIFGGNIPQHYEELLGPFLFEPFAQDLADRIEFAGLTSVLELACGSGRVTRYLAERLPATAQFIASDLSPEMIAVAKEKVTMAGINWAEVNMLTMPYPDNQFDLIVCQFGIMLVPDQQAALTEIFRVLKKGGRLIFNTWAAIEYNPLWLTGQKVLDAYLIKNPVSSSPGPFAMSDETVVLQQLAITGFINCSATLVQNTAQVQDAGMAANGFLQGLPILLFIQQQNPEKLETIIKEVEQALISQFGNHPLILAQGALVFEALK